MVLAVLFSAILGCSPQVPSGGVASTPTGSAPVFAGDFASYYALFAACLRAEGFAAVVNDTGDGYTVDVLPEGQRSAFRAAQGTCEDKIGRLPPPQPLSEEAIRAQYRYLLTARECLLGLGYSIGEPPTEDAFVESWETGPWSPFTDVGNVGAQEWQELNERCPQVPRD